jgi:hypothetical protein
MTLLICILGGLGCAVIGVVAGYRYCAHVNGEMFQDMVDSGQILVKTEDGWVGDQNELENIWKVYSGEIITYVSHVEKVKKCD